MRRGLKTTTRYHAFLAVLRQRSALGVNQAQNAKFMSFCYFHEICPFYLKFAKMGSIEKIPTWLHVPLGISGATFPGKAEIP